MHDLLLIHELGARRVRWRYDDPSGVAETGTRPVRPAGHPLRPPAVEARRPALHPATPGVS